MSTTLYIATHIGLFIVSMAGETWQLTGHHLASTALTSVVVTEKSILVGAVDGIRRSTDGGTSWQLANEGLATPYVRWLAASAERPALILAGTEPADIFWSIDGGRSWQAGTGVAELRDRLGWYLPYSPREGCVRGFALPPGPGAETPIYAAVEVGGVLMTTDEGRSWQLVSGSDGKPDLTRGLERRIHPDVHSIRRHPQSPRSLTAATGGGLYRSEDAGGAWKRIHPGYIRDAWVHPDDPALIVAGPADGVDRNGRIEISRDGGRTWQADADGLDAPWPDYMVDRFQQAGDRLFAILSNGKLWYRPLEDTAWRPLPVTTGRVRALAVAVNVTK
ncbi:MAG: hypothetical protein QNJ22_11720 [Desulfosarcinaceae bacterium]|nr:hypothetical protein [Desulfosarcinaceae bacterium]